MSQITACGHLHQGLLIGTLTPWPSTECEGGKTPVPVITRHPCGVWFMAPSQEETK